MNKLQVLALAAILMTGLAGCEKAKITNLASADVFVRTMKNSQGAVVYAAVHSVFSYNIMTSVSVKSPDGKTLVLTNYQNLGNSFYNETVEADYSLTAPTPGVYTYTVIFSDGEQITYTNTLLSTTILPANITGLTKNAVGDSIYLTWNAITNTHAYQLKVAKGSTQVYFQSAFADGSTPLKTTLRIGFPMAAILTSGSGTYTFELDGLLFESTTVTDYLQTISIASKDIVL